MDVFLCGQICIFHPHQGHYGTYYGTCLWAVLSSFPNRAPGLQPDSTNEEWVSPSQQKLDSGSFNRIQLGGHKAFLKCIL